MSEWDSSSDASTDILWADHPTGRFVARRLPHAAADEPPYAIWVPHEAHERQLPVILALHGSGERGRDGRRQTTLGLGPVLPSPPRALSALVVFPQAAPEESWRGDAATRAVRALDAAIAEFDADPARVALTGLSLGGNGALHMALAAPERFTSLAVVCGWLEIAALHDTLRGAPDPYRAAAEGLAHLPVWLFHGALDNIVPVTASRRMIAALRDIGANARYSEYPDVGHSAWTPAYRDAELLKFLVG